MKVKKYVVDTMPDALQKIRAELGKDAVIINTKEIRVGGIFGLFAKKKVEVVAATDGNPDSSASRISPQPQGGSGMGSTKRTQGLKPQVSPAAAAPTGAPTVHPVTSAFGQTGSETAVSVISPAPTDDTLLREIKQMKEMMSKLAFAATQVKDGADPKESRLPHSFERLRDRLMSQDIRPELALSIVERAAATLTDAAVEPTMSAAKEAVKHQLVAHLTKQPIEPIRDGARIIHFVGPTGVGKTTTIAKLAAEQVLKHRKSIGLITSDTYRIAAIDQLRTYASILDIPLEVVFSPLDLQKAVERLSDRDMILMDTAGRNFRNEMAVSELHSLLRIEKQQDTILVLSLSMKYSDMQAVMNNFYKFGVGKVLFTKADETESFGSIVNLLSDFSLSLSYITDGQNVPDDIQLADPNHMANELTGDLHDE